MSDRRVLYGQSSPNEMMTNGRFLSDDELLDYFIPWIEGFDIRHARNWARLYRADREAAMCEANFWAVLQDCGIEVEPNAALDSNEKRPDYRCQKEGDQFYVEVTCIHTDRAAKHTTLPHPAVGKICQGYRGLNELIRQECIQKTRQCANLDLPCLLAVGTFHSLASQLCIDKEHLTMLLTGEQLIAWDIDVSTGEAVGETYGLTKFESAAFMKPTDSGFDPMRYPISALLVGGLALRPPRLLGLLHPNPIRPFNRGLLSRIEFHQLHVSMADCKLWTGPA